MTKGKFGFHRCGGENETGTAAYVQIYVKSGASVGLRILQSPCI